MVWNNKKVFLILLMHGANMEICYIVKIDVFGSFVQREGILAFSWQQWL
jgi:hypothetical protein